MCVRCQTHATQNFVIAVNVSPPEPGLDTDSLVHASARMAFLTEICRGGCQSRIIQEKQACTIVLSCCCCCWFFGGGVFFCCRQCVGN